MGSTSCYHLALSSVSSTVWREHTNTQSKNMLRRTPKSLSKSLAWIDPISRNQNLALDAVGSVPEDDHMRSRETAGSTLMY